MIKMIQAILNWIFRTERTPQQLQTAIPKEIKTPIAIDMPDPRDYEHPDAVVGMPKAIDYSEYVPVIKNQGNIGSCGSMALVTGIETLHAMKGNKHCPPLSELFHYLYVRYEPYMDTYPKDTGQNGRNAMKVAQHLGVCPDKLMPYITSKYNTPPVLPTLVESIAQFWKIGAYERCFSATGIKTALNLGKIVWLGLPVCQNIYTYKTGNLTYDDDEYKEIGGHAFLVVGYDDDKNALKVVNSWGGAWGQDGFGWMDYSYLLEAEWFDAWAFDLNK